MELRGTQMKTCNQERERERERESFLVSCFYKTFLEILDWDGKMLIGM